MGLTGLRAFLRIAKPGVDPGRKGYESSLDADPFANRNDWSRTSGLVIPNHALSPLSYIPKNARHGVLKLQWSFV